MRARAWGVQKPAMGAPILGTHLLARGLIGAWLFNEGGSLPKRDCSPFGQIVAASTGAITQSPGKFGGGCADFGTGANAGYQVTRRGTNWFTTSGASVFTCFSVCYPTSYASTNAAIFGVGETSDSNNAMYFGVNDTNGATELGCGNDGMNGTVLSGLTVTPNAWHAVAVSQSSSAARTFMVDGKLVANATSIAGGTIGSGQPYVMGYSYTNSSGEYGWKGKIDLIYLWNRALSLSELYQLWQDPFGMFAPPAVRWMNPATVAAGGLLLRRRRMIA